MTCTSLPCILGSCTHCEFINSIGYASSATEVINRFQALKDLKKATPRSNQSNSAVLDNVKGVTNCYEYTFGVNVVIQTLSRLKRVFFAFHKVFSNV